MRIAAALAALLLAACGSLPGSKPPAPADEYANGRWFDGKAFREGPFWVSEGRLTWKKPAAVRTRVDLKGGFVVPAFSEAHNHNVDHAAGFAQANAMYLRDGIYYLKNPNNLEKLVRDVRPRQGKHDTIDIVFSNGGLTSATGHPGALYRNILRFPAFAGIKPEELPGQAYFVVETPEQLEAEWPKILAGKPDFLKVYLLDSDNHEVNIRDARRAGFNGLSRMMVGRIVQKARAAKLRVSAHVETAADFDAAVKAGVDEVNHLPGYWIRPGESVDKFALTEAQAKAAAAAKVTVVTTTGISTGLVRDDAQLKKVQDNQRANLKLLEKAGVAIAIGSDNYMGTSAGEARHLAKLKAFDNATLLRLWTETSAQAVFPGRKIGKLAEGYEADFLVLEADPLADFDNVAKIRARVKQGRALNLEGDKK